MDPELNRSRRSSSGTASDPESGPDAAHPLADGTGYRPGIAPTRRPKLLRRPAAVDRALARVPESLRALQAVAIGGFLLRVVVVAVNAQVPLTRDLTRDPGNFVDLAPQLANGQGLYRDGVLVTYWPPGYLGFVSVFVKVEEIVGVGTLRFWIGLGQSALAGVSILVVGLLVRRRISPSVAFVSALVLALWPNQLLMSSVVMTEGLFTPLYTAGVAALLWRRRATTGAVALAGLLLGAAVLTRPAGAPVVIAAAGVVAWTNRRSIRSALASTALFSVVVLAVLAPWLLYTNAAVGTPTLSSFNGYNLCLGNADDADGEFDGDRCRLRPGESAVEGDSRMRSEAIEWMLRNPLEQPRLLVIRVRELVIADFYAAEDLPDDQYDAPIPASVVLATTQVWWVVVMYLAARGLWRHRSDSFFRAGAVLWGAALIGPLVTIGHIRFHDPLVPFMAICAAAWLVAGGPTGKATRDRQRSATDGDLPVGHGSPQSR